MNKNIRILKWLVIALVLLNIVTITTIVYLTKVEQTTMDESVVIGTGSTVNVMNGRFFRQNLGFNDEQMNGFRKANQAFRPVARAISIEIDSLKSNMFSELNKEHPDTIALNRLAERIGQLHGQLKYQTYQFYIGLKSICASSQLKIFEDAFQPLFKTENLAFPGGRRHNAGSSR